MLISVNFFFFSTRAEETTFNTKEKDQFEQFCATYATDLLPYLNKCLQSLFPPAQLANALGLSVSEISKKVKSLHIFFFVSYFTLTCKRLLLLLL